MKYLSRLFLTYVKNTFFKKHPKRIRCHFGIERPVAIDHPLYYRYFVTHSEAHISFYLFFCLFTKLPLALLLMQKHWVGEGGGLINHPRAKEFSAGKGESPIINLLEEGLLDDNPNSPADGNSIFLKDP